MTTPTHRRGAAVTEQLLATALGLIAERDSIRVSIEDIADRAGVNKTTVYRRWPDVNALIRDAVVAHADTAVPLVPTGHPRADLVRLCTDVVANLESPLGRALVMSGRGSSDPDLTALRARFWAERLEAAASLLGPDAPVADADLIMERLVGPLHFRVNERGLPFTSGAIEALVDHFLRGF